MKCTALTNSGINLVKIEQDKKPIVVAVRATNGTYSFKDATPTGNKKSHLYKKTNPKCTCSGQGKSGFTCPKIGSVKEGGPKKEHGSVWRVTPICSTVQKIKY
jgi:hypothetical protein